MSSITIQLSDEVRERVAARAMEAGHRSVEEYVQYMIEEDVLDVDVGAPPHLSFGSIEELESFVTERLKDDRSFEPDDAFYDRLRNRALHGSPDEGKK